MHIGYSWGALPAMAALFAEPLWHMDHAHVAISVSAAETTMTLARALAALLRRRGHRIDGAIRSHIDDFVEVVAEENPELDVDEVDSTGGDDDEDDSGDDGDGADLDDAEEDVARNQSIICPHCGEPIEIAIDLSGDDQDGIQDCSVCCRPMRIRYTAEHGHLGSFSVDPA